MQTKELLHWQEIIAILLQLKFLIWIVVALATSKIITLVPSYSQQRTCEGRRHARSTAQDGGNKQGDGENEMVYHLQVLQATEEFSLQHVWLLHWGWWQDLFIRWLYWFEPELKLSCFNVCTMVCLSLFLKFQQKDILIHASSPWKCLDGDEIICFCQITSWLHKQLP